MLCYLYTCQTLYQIRCALKRIFVYYSVRAPVAQLDRATAF